MSEEYRAGGTRPLPGGRQTRVVVVGAGVAGVQTAIALRERDWNGRITVLGEERHLPYDRPPLSKALLLGTAYSSTFDTDFAALDVELLLGRRAVGLRGEEHTLLTVAGPIEYDRLVIATGAEPVSLPGLPEGGLSEGDGTKLDDMASGASSVFTLRTLDDALALRPVLERRTRIAVVGAGWIGAELATAAREAGCEVTVVEAADQPLPKVLPPEVAKVMRAWYEAAGVTLRTGVPVVFADRRGVRLADGSRVEAEAVVVGTGARPATGWLTGSGVALGPDGAVLADDRLRTTVQDVYATGDCASFPSERYAERLLVHHWDNAARGPRTVALNLLGEDTVYDPVPYFWSEQFGRFVQYAGHHGTAERLLWRGDPTEAAWSVCWLRDGALVALLAVGRPRDLTQGRRLIERGAALDLALAVDPSVPLKSAVR